MTTEQLFDDLKQYISAEISASESRIGQRFDERLDALDNKIGAVQRELTTLLTEGFKGVAEAVDQHQTQLDEHDRRILRLEGRTEPMIWKPGT